MEVKLDKRGEEKSIPEEPESAESYYKMLSSHCLVIPGKSYTFPGFSSFFNGINLKLIIINTIAISTFHGTIYKTISADPTVFIE